MLGIRVSSDHKEQLVIDSRVNYQSDEIIRYEDTICCMSARINALLDAQEKERRKHCEQIETLRQEISDLMSSRDAALWHSEHRARLIETAGERLVRELRAAYSKPWKPLWKGLQRVLLRCALLFAPFMPKRSAETLRGLVLDLKPSRFQSEWAQACRRSFVAHVSQLPNAAPGLIEPKAQVKNAERARRILVADYRIPRPDVSAGERATFGLIADLCATGFEVVFCATDMNDVAPYRQDLEALGCVVITCGKKYQNPADYIRDEGHGFGSFYLIRVDVAEATIRSIQETVPDALVIFHAPDLYFLREGRAAELSKDPQQIKTAEDTRRRELAMMNACDHIVLVSAAEVPVLAAYIPRGKISVFPALYSAVSVNPPGFAARQHLFFLGGFKHTPNIDAVKWFVSHVWPRVHAALPDAEFHIVGAEAPEDVLALAEVPGVRHIGYVADLEPVLASYRLSVAPLLYGAGIKGKLGASLGAGVPSVCTTIAAEGMAIVDGLHALIRDEPQAFADAVIGLYCDEELWQGLSQNGRILVRENFSDSANRSSFLRVLERADVLPLDLYIKHCQQAAPEAFPLLEAHAPVDVSIIVPVYNKWALTRACLNSLLIAGRATGLRYEVIIADDGSDDETLQAGELYPNLKVVRTSRNSGFLMNCKHAAAHACGRHILFLNNDTVVLPGWLEPMVRALDEDPRIAIAGSRLLYPDGSIQETGAVLFSDGSAGNIGRGHARQTRLYSLSREVDYATGASMLVRGAFWREIGGFDGRYMPAYCEDSDLAMTARERGYRVVCVSNSQVIHFEHGSYAAESAAQPKALASVNGAKFLAKWAETLEARHKPVGTPTDIAAAYAERQPSLTALERRRTGKLNVLYFSPFPSHPDNHGNQATIQAFGRHFRELGHKVHFALLQSHIYNASALAQMDAAWDSLDILPNQCELGSNGKSIPFDGWYEEGLGQHIRVLCDTYDIDVVFCSYIFQSRLLDYVPVHILKVIDTHDKMGDRYEMLRKNGQPLEFFSCTPEEEGGYLRRGDIVVARRAEEAAYFNSVTKRNSAIVIPHVEEARFLDRSFDKLTDVGMVASANRINLAITLQLLQAIDTQVGGAACPFTLHIAGQVRDLITTLPEEDQALFARPWVKLHGFVIDIGAFYRTLDLVISPVTMGTGINVKTVQAMAYGMPLLTTRWGGKGIETGHKFHDHENLDALVATLIAFAADPSALEQLAEVSRHRYQVFYDDSISAMASMFSAVKM